MLGFFEIFLLLFFFLLLLPDKSLLIYLPKALFYWSEELVCVPATVCLSVSILDKNGVFKVVLCNKHDSVNGTLGRNAKLQTIYF